MHLGTYSAAAALDNMMQYQDAVARNITGSAQAGHKKVGMGTAASASGRLAASTNSSFSQHLDQAMPKHEKKIFFDQGALRGTGNPLNVAIDGDGFFQVQTKSGSTFLTRNGDFRLDANRTLVDSAGNKVLSESGTLELQAGQGDIFIDDQGQVFQGSTLVGKISVVDVSDKDSLIEVGGAFMIDPSKNIQTQPPKSYYVRQGALEQSNHSVSEGMVNLIDLGRSHESAHTLIRSLSDQAERMVKTLGRLA